VAGASGKAGVDASNKRHARIFEHRRAAYDKLAEAGRQIMRQVSMPMPCRTQAPRPNLTAGCSNAHYAGNAWHDEQLHDAVLLMLPRCDCVQAVYPSLPAADTKCCVSGCSEHDKFISLTPSRPMAAGAQPHRRDGC